MENLNVPNDLNVALRIEEYFNPGATVEKTHKRGYENIALIKDSGMDLKHDIYYTVIYHSDGYVLCLYSQKFDSLFGALVVYKKLCLALEAGNLERAWHDIISKPKRKYES